MYIYIYIRDCSHLRLPEACPETCKPCESPAQKTKSTQKVMTHAVCATISSTYLCPLSVVDLNKKEKIKKLK